MIQGLKHVRLPIYIRWYMPRERTVDIPRIPRIPHTPIEYALWYLVRGL